MTLGPTQKQRRREGRNVFDRLAHEANFHVGDIVLINGGIALAIALLDLPVDLFLWIWAGLTGAAALALLMINLFSTRGMRKAGRAFAAPAVPAPGDKRNKRRIGFGISFEFTAVPFGDFAAMGALILATLVLAGIWLWARRPAEDEAQASKPKAIEEGHDPWVEAWKE
jgi:hypothetical protein